MNYQDLAKHAEQLNYRDKLRLAQLLLQLGRKEEEEQNPEKRTDPASSKAADPELVQYVSDRLKKLRPGKRPALANAIHSMFQFQGAIAEGDINKIIEQLIKRKILTIASDQSVTYIV